jgi:hypothetical protein
MIALMIKTLSIPLVHFKLLSDGDEIAGGHATRVAWIVKKTETAVLPPPRCVFAELFAPTRPIGPSTSRWISWRTARPSSPVTLSAPATTAAFAATTLATATAFSCTCDHMIPLVITFG